MTAEQRRRDPFSKLTKWAVGTAYVLALVLIVLLAV